MTICLKFGTDGWYCVTKSKIFSFVFCFCGGLTFFDQRSLLKVFSSPEILDISSPLTKSAVFHIPKKIEHGGCEDSNGKEADFVRNFTQFKLC